MDHAVAAGHASSPRLPRTRGDGPAPVDDTFLRWRASPYTRGWTRHLAALSRRGEGFPRHTRGWTPVEAPRMGGTREHVQHIAGHRFPKTTKLYDRTADTVTVDNERIMI